MHKEFMNSLLKLERYKAREWIFSQNEDVNVIESIIVPALSEIGEGWQTGIYSLSQVYMSSVICEEISEKLFSDIQTSRSQKLKIGIVTFDDYHTFGKKIVLLTLRSAGYAVHDLGMILDEKQLFDEIQKSKIDVLLMSVLMLPPALRIKELKPKLLEVNPNIKLVVGGAPFRFDSKLAEQIGADATGETPQDAIKIIRELEALHEIN